MNKYLAEFIGTAVLTGYGSAPIGLTLVLIRIAFIPVTGVSVNPARSIGPALFAGAHAIGQLRLFIVVPPIGGDLAGLLFRAKLPEN